MSKSKKNYHNQERKNIKRYLIYLFVVFVIFLFSSTVLGVYLNTPVWACVIINIVFGGAIILILEFIYRKKEQKKLEEKLFSDKSDPFK